MIMMDGTSGAEMFENNNQVANIRGRGRDSIHRKVNSSK
jgi:hypothetical protein